MIQPHAYQVPIIKDVAKALKRDGKTLMVMATGTGKTITGALVVQKILRSKERMLFLCHTNDILRQSMLAYGKVFNGSRSMGMFTGEEKVDPKTVQFLFASFQTMNGWKSKFDPEAFDMIVVDESHHAQAETYRPTIEYFRPKFLLGKTATPDREDGKNIRDLFGDPSVTLSLEEAIARKYLSDIDYKLMTVGTASRDAINELKRRVQAGERITLRELNDNIFIERLDTDIAEDIMSYKAQGIIFCTDIKQAEGMAKLLKKARPYHSKLDRNELDADLEGFRRGRIKYLLTVNMFNEGIDVPDTELVVFLRSTESRTVYLQQLGRGLRKSPGKTKVTVLDFVGNCDRIKMVSDFMKKIGDYGPGDHRDYDDVIPREIDVSSIIFDLDQEARDIHDIMRRIDAELYPTLAEASKAAQGLNIKQEPEYKARYREDRRLPSNPNFTYREEWVSWPRFLRGEDKRTNYPTYADASAAARALKIKSGKEYVRRYREDEHLPGDPRYIYPEEWQGWSHFLTGKQAEGFYPTLVEAKIAVGRLDIKDAHTYYSRYHEDERLPSRPNVIYASEWVNWPDFLRGENKKTFYRTYAEASAAAQKLGIKTVGEYRVSHKKDPMLPFSAHSVYASDWLGWTHFLTGESKAYYPTFAEAASAARRLGIRTGEEYYQRREEDPRLPYEPKDKYSKDWKSWSHFLQGKEKVEHYPSFAQASVAARRLGITSYSEYAMRYKEDPRLPSNPNIFYAKEWKGSAHFLSGEAPVKCYSSFKEASIASRKLKLRTVMEYKSRYREDPRLPACPDEVYKKHWKSWPNFLRDEDKNFYPTLSAASVAARRLGIRSYDEYHLRYKSDTRLPSNPNNTYSKEWKSWPHFLGKVK